VTEFTDIPILDLAPLRGDDWHHLAQEFRDAYATTGFAYVINHGVDEALVDQVFAASRAFHALPLAEKMTVSLNDLHRGYIAINTSTDVNSKLADVKKPNQSASFMMMHEDEIAREDVYLSGPNQWPALPGFRQALETYNYAMNGLGEKLMQLALLACEVQDTSTLAGFQPATTWLRLLHYPPMPAQSHDDLYGSAPHTDFGCLTILAQDGVGGLQVQTPAGQWIDAPKINGSFVVNVGDMLHRMSNGLLRSTPHRVINRSGQERYSCPFFYDPHVDFDVRPLTPAQTPLFPPSNFGEFLRQELGASYDRHKPEPRAR
jgi:isopenicillin N synthase-like dioxygenase